MASYFVDESGGDDGTGDGSIGTPWASVQHSLDTITQGASGDVINIKGTQTITAKWSFATYGSPTSTKPLIFRGYDETENDGVQCLWQWSSHTDYVINETGKDGISFIDIVTHGDDAAPFAVVKGYSLFYNCEIANHYKLVGDIIQIRAYCTIQNCYFHDNQRGGFGATLIEMINGYNTSVIGCYFDSTGGTPCQYVIEGGQVSNVFGNIIIQNGRFGAIWGCGNIIGNTLLCTGASCDYGIKFENAARPSNVIANNIIEGFTEAGAKGFYCVNSDRPFEVFNNAFFNNTTHADYSTTPNKKIAGNIEPDSSPLQKTGAMTYANRAEYFAPTSDAKNAGWPSWQLQDIGAVQQAPAVPVFVRRAKIIGA